MIINKKKTEYKIENQSFYTKDDGTKNDCPIIYIKVSKNANVTCLILCLNSSLNIFITIESNTKCVIWVPSNFIRLLIVNLNKVLFIFVS